MKTTLIILLSITGIASILPLFRLKHWVFRVWEFGYVQLFFLQIILVLFSFLFLDKIGYLLGFLMGVNAGFTIYFATILLPFTPLYNLLKKRKNTSQPLSEPIRLISVNVLQFNEDYKKLIDLVKKEKPHILLTIESNAAWEKALEPLEEILPNTIKIPLENTYGMHFYTNLNFEKEKVHYFISDDIPCLEAKINTNDGFSFDFYGVHPPPPSPTEEETSKERDGELMALAKHLNEKNRENVVVVGDFNNVAWAASSRRFRRLTGFINPRFGRGLIATFHAKYWFLRFPIDLMFHGENIYLQELERLPSINSDHFPLKSEFSIAKSKVEESDETPDEDDHEIMEEEIQEGKEEKGDR